MLATLISKLQLMKTAQTALAIQSMSTVTYFTGGFILVAIIKTFRIAR